MSCGANKTRWALFDRANTPIAPAPFAAALFGEFPRSPSPIRCRPGTKDRRRKQSPTCRARHARRPDFVPAAERIAVFDNDGTLWAEQPIYFQVAFALDRVKARRPASRVAGRAAVQGCDRGRRRGTRCNGREGPPRNHGRDHAGMTTMPSPKRCRMAWRGAPPALRPAIRQSSSIGRRSLLAYLRANGFKTFIVSGGGVEFMRVFAETDLRHPARAGGRLLRRGEVPERAGRQAGARQGTRGRIRGRRARQASRHQPLHRAPSDPRLRQFRWRPPDAAMDGSGQRRPLHGSSTTTTRSANGPTIAVSDRPPRQGARRGDAKGWTVVNMKRDWKSVFAFEP